MYDARELYSAIASLHHRPFTQLYWTLLEKRHARRAALILTVNQSIGDILGAAFPAVAVQVFRNVPRVPDVIDPVDLRSMLNIPAGMTILLVLGGLQAGRGILPSVEALAGLPECVLVCLGSGPLREEILRVAETRGVGGRVHIVDTVPSKEVLRYAAGADVGLCMIENLGRSYYLSLPNKLFECIAAGVPVVGSSFPEIETVIRESGVGVTTAPHAPGIVEAVRMLVRDRDLYAACKARCVTAAARHAWQAEEARFRALFGGLIQRA